MSVVLVDLEQEDKSLSLNWWNWRPTIEIIRSFDLIDDGMLELMGYN